MKISFDFDGTLADEFNQSATNKQKEEIQDLAKKYVSEGHDVCIITKRYGPENSKLGLGYEHLPVLELAKKLGIKDVHFTNRELKFSQVIKLGIDRHFENDDYEVNLINEVCKRNNHTCQVIPVEQENWRSLLV